MASVISYFANSSLAAYCFILVRVFTPLLVASSAFLPRSHSSLKGATTETSRSQEQAVVHPSSDSHIKVTSNKLLRVDETIDEARTLKQLTKDIGQIAVSVLVSYNKLHLVDAFEAFRKIHPWRKVDALTILESPEMMKLEKPFAKKKVSLIPILTAV